MKRMATAAALLVLGGCNQSHGAPNGRFQMLPSDNEQHDVYLLDTVNGNIWICRGNPNSPPTVNCGIPENVKEAYKDAP